MELAPAPRQLTTPFRPFVADLDATAGNDQLRTIDMPLCFESWLILTNNRQGGTE